MLFIVAALALFAPTLVFAEPRTFKELVELFLVYINAGIGIALIAGIVIYFYGVATAIPHMRGDDSDRLRAHFVWGIIALFVMFSVWGILALLRNTLFAGGYSVGGSYETTNCITFDDCVIGQ